MLENLTCTECGNAYYGDPSEVRLCLACDPDDVAERNVSVFTIDTVTDHEFEAFGTLAEALAAADEAGLEDADWCIDEKDAVSHHQYDVHYRNDEHRSRYQAALEAAKQAWWEEHRREVK